MSASLSGLTIGTLTLTPEFDPTKTAYTATTTNSTNAITATAPDGVSVEIKVGETAIENGGRATWEDGENTVTVTATAGKSEKVYTVTVTKS